MAKAGRARLQYIAKTLGACGKPNIHQVDVFLKVSRREMPNEMMFIKALPSRLMALCKTGVEPLLKDAFICRSSFKWRKVGQSSPANHAASRSAVSVDVGIGGETGIRGRLPMAGALESRALRVRLQDGGLGP